MSVHPRWPISHLYVPAFWKVSFNIQHSWCHGELGWQKTQKDREIEKPAPVSSLAVLWIWLPLSFPSYWLASKKMKGLVMAFKETALSGFHTQEQWFPVDISIVISSLWTTDISFIFSSGSAPHSTSIHSWTWRLYSVQLWQSLWAQNICPLHFQCRGFSWIITHCRHPAEHIKSELSKLAYLFQKLQSVNYYEKHWIFSKTKSIQTSNKCWQGNSELETAVESMPRVLSKSCIQISLFPFMCSIALCKTLNPFSQSSSRFWLHLSRASALEQAMNGFLQQAQVQLVSQAFQASLVSTGFSRRIIHHYLVPTSTYNRNLHCREDTKATFALLSQNQTVSLFSGPSRHVLHVPHTKSSFPLCQALSFPSCRKMKPARGNGT